MFVELTNLLPQKIYFSGEEEAVRRKSVKITLLGGNAIELTISSASLTELEELRKRIVDKSTLDTILSVSKIRKSSLLGLYKNEDGLRTYYTVYSTELLNSYLIIFSFGEEQPTKYAVQVESVWPSKEG